MTVYTTLPTDDENLEVTVIDDPDLVTLNINPAQVTGSGGTTGTVERVDTGTGLTGGPITTTGTISIDETSDISFNSVTADMFGVQHFVAKARETISAGQPVYISGHSGNTPEVMVADYTDPNKMPAFGIASTDIADNTNGSISTYGDLKNVDTTGTSEGETWAVGDSLYVNGAKLTNIRPTSATQEIQKVAKVIRVHANTGQMFLTGAGRSNDTPNLAHQNVFIGNAGGVERRQLTSADITNSAGYITADSTDTLSNKSGNISQWTNDAGYITSETDNQTLAFTTPNLSISNGNSVDLTTLTTGFITASSTETLTNKSGSNSQWTNDANYTTNSGVDIHLNKSVANPEDFLKWTGSDYTWQGLSTVAISNSYFDLDDKPTIPTINSNADNRIITGSATAGNLNGEADFTWDGNNGVIDGTASNLTTPVLNVKTDNSGWFTGQMMLTDANDDVATLVGANRNNFYEYNFTLDPNNTHGRTGVTTYAGDYFIAFRKNYSDPANVKMELQAFGAHGGFDFTVRDDFNSNGQYKGRPLNFNCEEANFNLGPDRNVLALTVAEDLVDCKVPIGQARLSSDPANPSGGWTYYNTTTNKLRLYVDLTGWVDLN